jgi:hypothetical protein
MVSTTHDRIPSTKPVDDLQGPMDLVEVIDDYTGNVALEIILVL